MSSTYRQYLVLAQLLHTKIMRNMANRVHNAPL
jgi:hypothetical protein